MPVVTVIRKEATPEQLGWRSRLLAAEPALQRAFLAWVQTLRALIDEPLILNAIATRAARAFDSVLASVAFQPDLRAIAAREATIEFERLARQLRPGIRIAFDLRNPNFEQAVADQQARLVREVTDETRRALANAVARAYRQGVHPNEIAPRIRLLVGLTSRQTQAVLSFRDALTRAGGRPDVVARRTDLYATRMLTRRAKTIAATETARAATEARLQSYEQAAQHGLFDRGGASIQWSAVQQDPREICAILDGQTRPLGETFDGLLPPAHPNCRCSVTLVL